MLGTGLSGLPSPPRRSVAQDFRALVRMIDTKIAAAKDIRFATRSWACDGRPVFNLNDGNICVPPTGNPVLVTVVEGIPFPLANVNNTPARAEPPASLGAVKPPPTIVKTMPATDVADTSATLNAKGYGSGAVPQTVSFQWGTDRSYGHVSDSQVVTALAVAVAIDVTLPAGSEIHYRAMSVAAGGATVYGADLAFFTPAITTVGATL